MWDFTWRMSDCEELVGVSHRSDEVGFENRVQSSQPY